jgi:molecular chaperone GrpE
MDNLSYAIDAAKSENSLQTVFEGVTSTLAGFENALTQAGVEPIDAIGQSFDPQLHEAVDTVEVRPEDDGKVIAEYSRGFKIGDRLLRPARVKVGRARPESKEAFQ